MKIKTKRWNVNGDMEGIWKLEENETVQTFRHQFMEDPIIHGQRLTGNIKGQLGSEIGEAERGLLSRISPATAGQ
ncbi:hypothetical protein VIGAN_01201200 [Vigna angularis var. angularis]|uniref:Uncharacterized protein n=1 Tax=Vigna angularis var. angularis TaxID=157739 RepID=A0A0S3R1A7_PHAAN|nr:hypothetical protein VIGAN_01201200 [Vigna angularis var. angularis]